MRLLRRSATTKRLLPLLAILLTLAVGISTASVFQIQPVQVSAQQGGPPGAGGGLVVRTVPVAQGPISTVLGYAGARQASQQVSVVPRTTGILEQLPVDVQPGASRRHARCA